MEIKALDVLPRAVKDGEQPKVPQTSQVEIHKNWKIMNSPIFNESKRLLENAGLISEVSNHNPYNLAILNQQVVLHTETVSLQVFQASVCRICILSNPFFQSLILHTEPAAISSVSMQNQTLQKPYAGSAQDSHLMLSHSGLCIVTKKRWFIEWKKKTDLQGLISLCDMLHRKPWFKNYTSPFPELLTYLIHGLRETSLKPKWAHNQDKISTRRHVTAAYLRAGIKARFTKSNTKRYFYGTYEKRGTNQRIPLLLRVWPGVPPVGAI